MSLIPYSSVNGLIYTDTILDEGES